jgi:hypothetical protein
MGDRTSIRKFNGLTTAGGGVLFDVGTLSRSTGFLSRDPGALGGNPDTLSSDPDALSFNPEALSRDPDVLSCDTDALRFDPDALSRDPETLSFDVFHQKQDSNCLITSHLRIIRKNSLENGRAALLRGLGRPAGRPYHKIEFSKPSRFAFPNFQLLTPNSQ